MDAARAGPGRGGRPSTRSQHRGMRRHVPVAPRRRRLLRPLRVELGRWQHRRVAPASTAVPRRDAGRAAGGDRQLERPSSSSGASIAAAASAAAIAAWRTATGSRDGPEVMHGDERLVDRALARPPRDGGSASTAAGRPRSPGRRARAAERQPVIVLADEAVLDASSRPWARSASRTPSPRRGPCDDRGGPLVSSASNASAIDARSARSAAGRPGPAGAAPGAPLASGRAIRARTRSWNDDVRDTAGQLAPCCEQLLGHQRAPAGALGDDNQHARRRPRRPRSTRSAGQARRGPRGASVSRAGGRGAASRPARSTDHGSSRRIASAW